MDPIIAERNIPKRPDEEPIKEEIYWGFNNANIIPTIIIILRNWGIIFSKDFIEILRACQVLSLLLIKEKISKEIAKVYKIMLVINSPKIIIFNLFYSKKR